MVRLELAVMYQMGGRFAQNGNIKGAGCLEARRLVLYFESESVYEDHPKMPVALVTVRISMRVLYRVGLSI